MKRFCKICIALVGCAIALGCGGNGASNNDQGVSVTFLGLFSEGTSDNSNGNNTGNQGAAAGTQGCAQLPQGLTGAFISYAAIESDDDEAAGITTAYVGLQNNMQGQFFRADRLMLEYYIPGASIQPPAGGFAINLLVGPAESGQSSSTGNNNNNNNAGNNNTTTTNPNNNIRKPIVTSLPPAFQQLCNRTFGELPIITPAVRDWLKFNRNQLPGTPFTMEVIIKLSGLSSSGNRYETNEGLYPFIIVSEVVPTPTPSASSASVSEESHSAQPIVADGDESAGEDVEGIDELETAFETESVVEGTEY